MKTILVPTDFSDISGKAVDYAAELAKPFNAKVILYHAYHIPVVISEMPVELPSEVEMEKDITRTLKKIKNNIQSKYGKAITVETVCKQGFAVDVISGYVSENKVDLVVMGTQGGGFVMEKVIGSVTSSMIKKCKCPVLVIGKDTKFEDIKNIVLACDYREIRSAVLKPLKELSALFKSHVHLLHVNQAAGEVPSLKEAEEGIKLDHLLEDIDHSFDYSENENVIDGLNQFARSKNADIMVMVSREHSFIWNLFHESNTKKMAFHSTIPLLVLHQ